MAYASGAEGDGSRDGCGGFRGVPGAADPAVLLRPFARFRAHTHTRPLFLCRACGGRWPCQPARLALLAIYRDDPEGLRTMLAGRLLIALADQPRLDPIALTTRFLGWIPPAP